MAEVQHAPNLTHEIMFEAEQLPRLRFNRRENIELSTTGWMLPTPKETPLDEMRTRYEEKGYLWVKNLLPREDVYDMREQ